MTKEHYRNAVSAKLADYITPDRFRTVLAQQREITAGLSEIPVEFELQKDFIKSLSFPVQWDGLMYGYYRGRKIIEEKVGAMIKRVVICDWNEKFVVIFEKDNGVEDPVFYVAPEDVRLLLEKCLRVPEQRSDY